MNILQSIILGVVEGATEFLPVSSTAHLILVSNLLKISQTDFVKTFEVVIQFGAILSVVVLYWRKFLLDIESIKRIIVAFIPTAIIGFLLYKVIKNLFFENNLIIILALFFGGILIILFELFHKEKEDANLSIKDLSYTKCFAIGLFQSIAVIPGVSRSAATIIGGLLLNIRRNIIVEFSFLLAVPTMLAASVLDISKNIYYFSLNQIFVLSIGFIVSFIVALLSIKFLISFVKSHSFIGFGIYRIIIAVMFFFLLFTR